MLSLEVLIKWMYSYLTGRTQYVKIKISLSSPAPVLMVYHKEAFLDLSYLSCLLNDFSLHSSLELDPNADDSTSHSSGKIMNEVNDKLSTSMENIEKWCSGKGMITNGTKTKTMVVTTY